MECKQKLNIIKLPDEPIGEDERWVCKTHGEQDMALCERERIGAGVIIATAFIGWLLIALIVTLIL